MMSSVFLFLFLLFPPEAPYGKPAPASVVFRHVPEGAVLVAAADVASLGQGIDRGLDRFMKTPFLGKEPALAPLVRALTAGRRMVKAETKRLGIDPFKDIRYAMVAMRPRADGEDQGILVLGGEIPAGAVDALATMAGARKQDDGWILEDRIVLTRAPDGTVLFGSRSLVELALKGGHRNQAIQPLLRGYDRQTYLLVAFQPDRSVLNQWKNEGPLVRPMLESIKGLSLRSTYRGTVLKLHTRDAALVKAWRSMLEGVGKLSVASWYASDGFLDLVDGFMATLDPEKDLPPQMPPQEKALVAALINNRRQVVRLIGDLALGQKTRTSLRTNQRQKSVTLRLAGLSITPLLLASVGYLLVEAPAEPEPSTLLPPPAGPPSPGGNQKPKKP